jgi:hypothetical protein
LNEPPDAQGLFPGLRIGLSARPSPDGDGNFALHAITLDILGATMFEGAVIVVMILIFGLDFRR